MDAVDPQAFFAAHGFGLRFVERTVEEMREIYVVRGTMSATKFEDQIIRRGVIGPIFANLYSLESGREFWPNFGSGKTEEEAAASARERWRWQEGE